MHELIEDTEAVCRFVRVVFFFFQAGLKAGLSESEIKEALELSTSKEIKEKLKSATQKALDYGVSGPFLLIKYRK